MAILSKIKKAAKKVKSFFTGSSSSSTPYATLKVANEPLPSSTKSSLASAADAFSSATSKSTPSTSSSVGSNYGITVPRNYLAPTPGGLNYNNPANLAYQSNLSKGGTPYSLNSQTYGPPAPRTISKSINSGKQDVSSGGAGISSFSPMSFDQTAFSTLSSSSLGGSTGGTAPSGGTSPVTIASAPGNVNPRIDNTAIAGKTAGIYEVKADGTMSPVERKEQTLDNKMKERADLYEKYLGMEPDVEDDREVRAARRERERIQQALQAPTAELNAIIAQQQKDLLQLRQTGANEGVTEAVYGAQSAAVNYNAAIRALPLQASIASLQNDLELATDYLNELRTTKQKQIDRQYNFRKMQLASIEKIIETDEKREYEEAVAENERAKEEEEKLVDFQAELSMQVMQNAPESLRANVLSRVNASSTIQEAIQAAGKYGVPPNTQLTQLDNGDTVLIDKNTGRIVSNVGGRKAPAAAQSFTGLTAEQASDPFIQKLAQSAGGKPMTDTSIQKLDKALGVLDQLGVLQTNIKNMKTGPIVGAFRGKNPWDTNAQVIKAQLNGIVPNLARGVYGEVGVLTDNDIRTYSQTLPNLKSTDDIRNAVLGITIDLVSRSVKRTLEVNAANQKDVSQFIDLYTEMQSTRDSIFSQIPGYKGAGGSTNVDYTATLDAIFQ